MAEKAKIALSNKELELVTNTDWILTKYLIIEKVYAIFGELITPMQATLLKEKDSLPDEVHNSYPKISKGENYKSLPYVMLDYPRCFNKQNTLTIRTFFWWGNFFSVTLQLSGSFKTNITPALLKNFQSLSNANYSICIAEDQWQHHFSEDNYIPLNKYTEKEYEVILKEKDFVKIAKSIPLQKWNEVPLFLEQSFNELILLLKN